MARPIKETPVLRGADAIRFRKNMESETTRKVSQDELDRMRKNFDLFQSKITF
jgi:hypothetical protein